MVALVPILVFGLLLGVVSVPFVALGPGPTFDTLGEYDGKPVVAIEGTPVKPTSGHLNMTTVSQRDGLSLGQALVLWGSGSQQLVPRDLVFPPEKSREDIEKSQNADFQNSEDNAEYAALASLTGDISFDLARYIGQLQTPTTIVLGAGSRFTAPATVKRLASLNPNAIDRLIEIPNSGVLPHLEHPAVVVGLLRQFLENLDP